MEKNVLITKKYRLKKWSQNNSQGPVSAEFHITDRCNLNCLSCWKYKKKREYIHELNIQQWKEILDQAIDLGIITLYLGGGGEPFFKEEILLNIIIEAKKRKIYGDLTTNGTFCESNIVKKIVATEWDSIQVSIDGPDADTQDYLRNKKGVFKKNIYFLKLFMYWKKKLYKSKPVISFHTVISNRNYTKLEEITRLASKYKCNTVFFQQLVIQNEYCNNIALYGHQRNNLIKRLTQVSNSAKKLKVQTNVNSIATINEITTTVKKPRKLFFFNYPFTNAFCFEPFTHITIKSNGLVQTCCNPLHEYESINKKSLKTIWFSNKFNSLRKRMIQNHPPTACCTHPTKRNEQERLRNFLSIEKNES